MADISGTIYRYGSDSRIAGACVKATKESEVHQTVTDDDGNFTFANLDPGKWTLVAFHEASFPGEPQELELAQDETGVRINLLRLEGTEDKTKGTKFFTRLLIALGVLVVVYSALHLIFPGGRAPLSASLSALISQAEKQIGEAQTISTDETLLRPAKTSRVRWILCWRKAKP